MRNLNPACLGQGVYIFNDATLFLPARQEQRWKNLLSFNWVGTNSISGSSVAVTGGTPLDEMVAGTVTFQVSAVSPDNEYIPQVVLTAPAGWTLTRNNESSLPLDRGTTSVAGSGTNNITYTLSGGLSPGLRNGDTWNLDIDVIAPAGSAGNNNIAFTLVGDGFGALPHNVSGNAVVTVNVSLSPDDAAIDVFQDFNGDGVRQSGEPLIPGLTVTAYDENNVQVDQDNSSTTGSYTLTLGAGNGIHRIEVTNLPSYLQPGAAGTTTVFFTDPGNTVEVALENPGQFSLGAPNLVTTCFIEGSQPDSTGETLIRFAYDSGCFDAGIDATCDDGGTFDGPKTPLADAMDIGSTFGLAYQRATNSLFVAAFMKRHSGFKSNGKSGVIYRVQNPNTASPIIVEYIDFDALGIPTQPVTGDPHPADGAPREVWERDDDSWDWVGKMSFGDLDISEDEEDLYVVNLFDRKLYRFPAKDTPYTVADAGLITAIDLPQPCGSAVDARPFGLGVYNGKVYFSMVCSGESTIGGWAGGHIPANTQCNENTPPVGDRTSLSGKVYEYDPVAGTVNMTPVLDFPLDYGRGLAINSNFGRTSATWNPWVTEWTVFNREPLLLSDGMGGIIEQTFQDRSYPQPMISDIEFDRGNMILGLRDRFGDQTGHLQQPPTGFMIQQDPDPTNMVSPDSPNLYDGVAEGDILRACGDPLNGWTLESGGVCGGVAGPPAPNANSNGPGGGEFYSQDDYDNFHNEVTQGGMVVVPGEGEVATIMTDPINSSTEFYDAGVVWYNNDSGQRVQNFLVFSTATDVGDDEGPTFAKANGLGDMVALSDPTPIQIGNRVWLDTLENGIQDPGDEGINGVLVELYKDIGGVMVKVAETTTAADPVQGDGAFKFTNSTEQTWTGGQTEVLPNMDYEIRVALANVQSVAPTAMGFATANATGDSSNGNKTDLDDSDADNSGIIAFSTGGAGENNHTLDIGLIQTVGFDLALVKRLDTGVTPGPYVPGGDVTFELEVYNQGDIDAVDIEIKDYIPEGMSLATSSATDWSVVADTAVLNTLIDLSADDSITISITFTIDEDFMLDTLTNRAEISSFDDDGDPLTDPPVDQDSTPNDNGDDPAEEDTPDEYADENPNAPGTEDNPMDEDDYDWEGIAVQQNFDLNLIKYIDTDATPGPFTYGSTVTFAIEVRNQGSLDATGVEVADYIPEGLSLVASPDWTEDVDTARWAMPFDLMAGDTVTLSISFTIDLDFVGTSIDNVAEISAATNALGIPDEDSTPGDNGDTPPEVGFDNEDDDDGPNGNGNPDNVADSDDFDFARVGIEFVSLGSTVFLDNNNDGLQNGADIGIEGVEVQLWDNTTMMQVLTDATGARVSDPIDAATVTTNAMGDYHFTNLIPGDYYVVIPTAPASAPISSNNQGIAFVETDPDDNQDGDDEGTQPSGAGTVVTSGVISLALGNEPANGTIAGTESAQGNTQDDAFDTNGNMTLDFGFFAPVSIGDAAFVDLNGDGLQSLGEPGIGGVTVSLLDENGNPVTTDAEGNTITGTVTTAPDGSYSFSNLPPGIYSVVFDIATADNAEFYDFTIPDAGDDTEDSDNSLTLTEDTAQSNPTDFLNSGGSDSTLDVGLICAIAVTVNEPFTICATQTIDLTLGTSLTPPMSPTFGATWTTPDGTGDFVDAGGAVLTAPYRLGTAVRYIPSAEDAIRGEITFILTTDDPTGPCEPVSASVTIQVLNVDCGAFPWDGN